MHVLNTSIGKALDGSTIYEEYRGNLLQATTEAQQYLATALQEGNSRQQGKAFFAQGIVYLLRGEAVLALSCFAKSKSLVPDDAGHQLLCFCYETLATRQRFQNFPYGGDAPSLELRTRWNQVATLNEEERRWKELSQQQQINPDVQIEAMLVYQMLKNLPVGRDIVGMYVTSPEITAETRLATVLEFILPFYQRALHGEAPPRILGYVDRVLADLYWHAGNMQSAQQHLQQADQLYTRLHDQCGIAACKMMQGDWLAAPISSPLVWNYLMLEGQWHNGLSLVQEAAESDRSRIRHAEAQQLYTEAEAGFHAADAQRGLGMIALRYGYLQMFSGQYDQVVVHASKALEYFEASGDTLGEWLAQAHCLLGQIGVSVRPQDSSVIKKIGQWCQEQGSLSFGIGLGYLFTRAGRHWLIDQGDYERALNCYYLAQMIFQQLQATYNEAQNLADQGVVYKLVGEQTTALTFYKRAQDHFVAVATRQPTLALIAWQYAIMVMSDMLPIYLQQQDGKGLQQCITWLQTAWGQVSAPSDQTIANSAMTNMLGSVIMHLMEMASSQIPIFKAIEAKNDGNFERADQCFEEALTFARQIPQGYRHEAYVLAFWRRYSEAEKAYQHHMKQAEIDIDQQEKQLIQHFGEDGRALAKRQRVYFHAEAALFLTRIKAYARAMMHLKMLEALAGPQWWEQDEHPWEIPGLYGEIYEGGQQLELALKVYTQAIHLLEQRRGLLSSDEMKTAQASDKASCYLYFYAARNALSLHAQALQQGAEDQARDYAMHAFAYAEQGKARALLDLLYFSAESRDTDDLFLYKLRMHRAQVSIWRSLLAQAYHQSVPNSTRIQQLTKQIEQGESTLRQLEREHASPITTFLQQAPIIDAQHVSTLLSQDTALLLYYFLSDQLLIWAITGQSVIRAYQLPLDAALLNRQIQAFHHRCGESLREQPEQTRSREQLGEQLAQTFLQPVAEILRDYPRLVIVPYGAAHLLPFHTLPWEGQPLVASHMLSYLPSASSLQFLQTVKTQGRHDRILAIGNPAQMAGQLPASGTEAAFVASLFPQGKALIDEQATMEEVCPLMPRYPLLHFATHGGLSEGMPLLSAIILANGAALSVLDLMGMKLGADLVVLSACNTARGKTTGGDDVLGLTRGLLAAGVRAAVVSLWPVNDISTCLLMKAFYTHLRNGSKPAAALQTAQNHLRALSAQEVKEELVQLKADLQRIGEERHIYQPVDEVLARHVEATKCRLQAGNDYQHPFHWAAFILVGL